jgi:hypothetical protein
MEVSNAARYKNFQAIYCYKCYPSLNLCREVIRLCNQLSTWKLSALCDQASTVTNISCYPSLNLCREVIHLCHYTWKLSASAITQESHLPLPLHMEVISLCSYTWELRIEVISPLQLNIKTSRLCRQI